MSVALVTCIYNKDYITGDLDPNVLKETRWQRFYLSLISLSRTKVPLVIYTSPNNVQYLTNFCESNLVHKQFKVVGLDLNELDYYQDIEQLKSLNHEINNVDNHYAQLVLSKPYLIYHAIKQQYFDAEKYFWIDAGLSFVSLFPKRYKTGGDYDWFGYNCFNEQFVQRLDNLTNIKPLFVVYNLGQGSPYLHNEGIYKHDSLSASSSYYVIGGLWGGYSNAMISFYNTYRSTLRKVIQYWSRHAKSTTSRIFWEEPIFSAVVCNSPQHYTIERFDTWYHEDDWTQVKNIKPGDRNFYKVITGEL